MPTAPCAEVPHRITVDAVILQALVEVAAQESTLGSALLLLDHFAVMGRDAGIGDLPPPGKV